jgi:hypothetical protein
MAIEMVDLPIENGDSQIIIIWLVVQKPSWKMMEFVNGKDDIPHMKWKIKNVWNHQPVLDFYQLRCTDNSDAYIYV